MDAPITTKGAVSPIAREIARYEMQIFNTSKSGPMGLLQRIQPVPVPIHGVDVCAEAEQLSQSQGKRAGTSPQVREGSAWG